MLLHVRVNELFALFIRLLLFFFSHYSFFLEKKNVSNVFHPKMTHFEYAKAECRSLNALSKHDLSEFDKTSGFPHVVVTVVCFLFSKTFPIISVNGLDKNE